VVMVTKKKKKKLVKKKTKKKTTKSKKTTKVKKKVSKKKPVVKIVRKRRIKCCLHCPDFEYCEDREYCCDYCDFYLNGKCIYGKKTTIPSVDDEIELPDYRGDDFGIDDYEAYESGYE
jgi:hypothetical protein